MIRRLLLVTTAALLAGCARTPPPALPPGDIPAAFEQASAKNAPIWPSANWWTEYGDPQLVALIEKAQAANLDLAQAEARLRQADAKAKVAALKLPPGVYAEFSGAAAAQTASRNQLLLYTAFALVLIGMILFISFHWRANTWLVLVNLPFSLIGSVAAIVLMGAGLSVGAMVGLVTVFGVSARNAILLLAHYEHLVEVEGAPWNADTVLRGAQERLVPILMTAAVTALGLMPLAIGLHQPGQEIEGPMAVTVLGGLISSTLLNLVVLPALAERFGGPKHREQAA